jgi:hypothetical protein
MQKLTALGCVIGWSGFWIFGYLALSGGAENAGQTSLAAALAGLGFLVGTFTYMRLGRDLNT